MYDTIKKWTTDTTSIPTYTCLQILKNAESTGQLVFEESYSLQKVQFCATEPYYAYAVRVVGRRPQSSHSMEAYGAAYTLRLAAEIAAEAFCKKLLEDNATVVKVEFPGYKLLSKDVYKMVNILCEYNDCLCDGLWTQHRHAYNELHYYRMRMTDRYADVTVIGEAIHDDDQTAELIAAYDLYRSKYGRTFRLLPVQVGDAVKLDHYDDNWKQFKHIRYQQSPPTRFRVDNEGAVRSLRAQTSSVFAEAEVTLQQPSYGATHTIAAATPKSSNSLAMTASNSALWSTAAAEEIIQFMESKTKTIQSFKEGQRSYADLGKIQFPPPFPSSD